MLWKNVKSWKEKLGTFQKLKNNRNADQSKGNKFFSTLTCHYEGECTGNVTRRWQNFQTLATFFFSAIFINLLWVFQEFYFTIILHLFSKFMERTCSSWRIFFWQGTFLVIWILKLLTFKNRNFKQSTNHEHTFSFHSREDLFVLHRSRSTGMVSPWRKIGDIRAFVLLRRRWGLPLLFRPSSRRRLFLLWLLLVSSAGWGLLDEEIFFSFEPVELLPLFLVRFCILGLRWAGLIVLKMCLKKSLNLDIFFWEWEFIFKWELGHIHKM